MVSKRQISKDTFVATFGFDSGKVLGVPCGYHLSIFGIDEEGKEVRHTYTPLSLTTTQGHVELLVKVYHPCAEFPKGGVLTQQLEQLQVGDAITVAGPRGKHRYLGRGAFEFKEHESQPSARQVRQLTFLAGGSGITPFIFLMRHIALDAADQTEVTLVFSNKTQDDVLLHDELLKYQAAGRLKYVWTLTREKPTDPRALEGRIDYKMIEAHIPPPAKDHLVFYCGPKGFNVAAKSILDLLDHEEANVVKY